MQIQNVTDAAFRKYGKVLEGYDLSRLIKEMEHTPCRWMTSSMCRLWRSWRPFPWRKI